MHIATSKWKEYFENKGEVQISEDKYELRFKQQNVMNETIMMIQDGLMTLQTEFLTTKHELNNNMKQNEHGDDKNTGSKENAVKT